MGKININELEKYTSIDETNKNTTKTKFFSLKADGDVARVRFCHMGLEDVEAVTLHIVKDSAGNQRKVACLRNYDDPIDACPFCKYAIEHSQDSNKLPIQPVQLRFFLSLAQYYQDGHMEKKVWERGKNFKREIISLTQRYSPLYAQLFEIERQGAPGDTATKYGIFPIPSTPQEYPLKKSDIVNESVIGGVIFEKTADEMNDFIKNGKFGKPNSSTTSTTNTSTSTEEDLLFGEQSTTTDSRMPEDLTPVNYNHNEIITPRRRIQ